MPLGNGNAHSGDKGSNWRYEFQVLQGLTDIANNTSGGGSGSATAANQVVEIGVLNSILSAIANGQAYTQALVLDSGGVGCPSNCPVYLEVRVWDPVTQTFGPPVYYNASGGVVTPVGPLTFVNDAFTLSAILVQDTAINGKLPAVLGQTTMANSLAVTIASNQSAIPTTLPSGTQTITSTNPSTSGSVTTGATSVAFTTDSSFVGTINGVARSASTLYSFSSTTGKLLPAIPYTITGGTIFIDTIV